VRVFWKSVRTIRPHQAFSNEPLLVGSKTIPLLMVRNPRARRYLLRLRPDGTARVTIPRGGNHFEARSFVERNRGWLEEYLQRLQSQPISPVVWRIGTEILFRGEKVRIEAGDAGRIRFGSESVLVRDANADLRPLIEHHLHLLSSGELPQRLLALAEKHQFSVRRITVRNQKTRWGSCSRRGTISLNWRLIQTPDLVRDYIMLHELAHLRHMNHSDQFWQEVEQLCPEYRSAEHWLKVNRAFLR